MSLPVVAIVGRPNVGKSTLFNRVLGRIRAVVDDLPGITRDRLYAQVDWAGTAFHLVDTGGWIPAGSEAMDRRILEQVLRALEECDLVLFLVDVREVSPRLGQAVQARVTYPYKLIEIPRTRKHVTIHWLGH